MTKKRTASKKTQAKKLIDVRRIVNPFDHRQVEVETWVWKRGKTVAEYLPAGVATKYVVARNGELILPEAFDKSYLMEGDSVVLCPIPQGGDGAKSILRIVAMVVVSYFTMGLGGMAGGSFMGLTGAAGWVAAGAAFVAGSMIVNSVLAPAKPTATIAGDSTSSASYGYDGPKNTSSEGVCVPVCYGTFRMGGNVIAIHTENSTNATTKESTQDLYMLLNAGEGPVAGIDSIQINNTEISGFKNVFTQTRLGYPDQPIVDWFSENIIPISKSLKITDTDFVTFQTIDLVQKVRLDFTCPSGLVEIDAATGAAKERSVAAKVQYRQIGSQDWNEMLSSSHADVEYEVKPVIVSAGISYDGLTPEVLQRMGYGGWINPNSPDSGFTWSGKIITGFTVNTPADAPTSVVPTDVLNSITEQLSSLVNAPADLWAPGFELIGTGDGSPITDYTHPLPMKVSMPVSTPNSLCYITGASRSVVRKSFSSPVLPLGRYEFRIKKIWNFALSAQGDVTVAYETAGGSQSPSSSYTMDDLWLADVNEITLDGVAYNNTALLAVKVQMDEQLSGIPTVTYINRGKLIRVLRRAANGTVTQTLEPSDNPAWIVYDMATNFRYGGKMLESRLDLLSFIEWAEFCDANKLTFNGVFDSATNFWDAAQAVLRVGHAQLIGVGTRFYIAIERSETPVMMFGMGNIIQGSFKQTWLPKAERANEIDVTYFDKSDNYKQKTVKVADTSVAINGETQRTSGITLVGIVTAKDAYREGALQLNLNKYILQTVEFQAPIESIACSVGNVIYVQHDMPNWAASGRLAEGCTSTSMKLDKLVTMQAGKTYKFMVIHDTVLRGSGFVSAVNGDFVALTGLNTNLRYTRLVVNGKELQVTSITATGVYVVGASEAGVAAGQPFQIYDTDVVEERDVVVYAGNTDTITLASPLPFNPSMFSNYMFGETAKVKKKYRVKAIATATSDLTRTITAVEYRDEVYDLSQYGELSDSPYDPYVPNNSAIGQVQNLDMHEESYLTGAVVASNAVATWDKPYAGIYAGATVEVSINDGTPIPTRVNTKTRLEIPANKGDVVKVRVIAFDIFSKDAVASAAPTKSLTIEGVVTADPGDVTGTSYVWSGRDCRILWRYNATTASYEFGSEPNGADTGSLDPSFKDYEVVVFHIAKDGTETQVRKDYVVEPFYVYTYEKNETDGLCRHLKFEIRMRDIANNRGKSAVIDAYNPPPQLLDVRFEPAFDSVNILYSTSGDIDFAGARVWLAQKAEFLGGDVFSPLCDDYVIYDGPNTAVYTGNLMPVTRYYVVVAAYDVFGTTDVTPSPVLEFETGYMDVNAIAAEALDSSKLLKSLQESIAKIDHDVPDSINSRIAAALATAEAAILDEKVTRVTEDASLASIVSGVAAQTADNTAAILTEQTARTSADGALSTRIDAVVARTAANEAYITTEQTARTNADTALANSVNTLQARLNSGGDISNAIIQTQEQVNVALERRQTFVQATAPTTPGMGDMWVDTSAGGKNRVKYWNGADWVDVVATDDKSKTYLQNTAPANPNTGDLWVDTSTSTDAMGNTRTNVLKRWSGTAWVVVENPQINALATSVKTLQTTVNGRLSSIESSQSIMDNAVDGLMGQYSIKIDLNGYVAGFGLSSTSSQAGVNSSEFIILADKFAVVKPGNGTTRVVPFSVQNINGVDQVTINSALIGDASINSAKIADAAITNAKITDLTVTSLKIASAQSGTVHMSKTSALSYRVFHNLGKIPVVSVSGRTTWNNFWWVLGMDSLASHNPIFLTAVTSTYFDVEWAPAYEAITIDASTSYVVCAQDVDFTYSYI